MDKMKKGSSGQEVMEGDCPNFGKSELQLLELVAQIIVEMVMEDDSEEKKRPG
ncbi:hypothetical protein [Pedobacter chitinilyticus]|uniref:hypothetical protein n=1 Tax=Pedobacter chitinilyticus TaxID=2233776 RepID=UPI001968FF6C|nr:hypothetical protein [Pedobacter chitinilyticus]